MRRRTLLLTLGGVSIASGGASLALAGLEELVTADVGLRLNVEGGLAVGRGPSFPNDGTSTTVTSDVGDASRVRFVHEDTQTDTATVLAQIDSETDFAAVADDQLNDRLSLGVSLPLEELPTTGAQRTFRFPEILEVTNHAERSKDVSVEFDDGDAEILDGEAHGFDTASVVSRTGSYSGGTIEKLSFDEVAYVFQFMPHGSSTPISPPGEANTDGGTGFDDQDPTNELTIPSGATRSIDLVIRVTARIGDFLRTYASGQGLTTTRQIGLIEEFYIGESTMAAGGGTTVRRRVVDAGGGGDHTTIQAAVDAASAGETIVVKAGTYDESVTISGTDDISLIGEGSPTVTGVGTGQGSKPHAAIHVDGAPSTRDITIEGLTIRNPDGHYGVYAGTGGSNSDVDGLRLRENTITDVATNLASHDPLAGSVAGIYVRAEYDRLEIETNEITNVDSSGNDTTNATGVALSSFIGDGAFSTPDAGSATASNTVVRDNYIHAITATRKAKGIGTSGEFDGVTIRENTIETLESTGDDVWAISLTENPGKAGTDIDSDGTDERIGPRNFDIRLNETDGLTAAGDPAHLFVGGYEDLGSTHVVTANNFLQTTAGVARFAGAQPGYDVGDGDTLDVRGNYWGAADGPGGDDGAGGSGAPAVTIPQDGSDPDGKVAAGEASGAAAGFSSSQIAGAGSSLAP